MSKEKVYLKFCEGQDLVKCVNKIRGLGGVVFHGVSQGFAVFETENNPRKFMDDLLAEGVKVSVGVVKTLSGVKGLVPLEVRCQECGERFSYLRGFSRSGTQLCDECLATKIECQPEGETNGQEEDEGSSRPVR